MLSLSAGCADLQWHRGGLGAAARAVDLTDCRHLARVDTAHLAWPFPNNTTRLVAADRAGRAVSTPYPYSTCLDTDRAVLVFELVGACMRNKGYALAPADKRSRP